MLTGHLGHAAEEFVEPFHIHPCGQAQAEREAKGPCPAARQIADIDGKGLVARVFGRKIGAAKMDVFQKKVAAHAKGAFGLEHGAVVAPAQQQ